MWHTAFITLIVIDMTVAIISQSVHAGLVVASIVTMMTYLFTKMGEIFGESHGILQAWLVSSKNNNDPWLKRRCKAYRALRANVGSFYYADKGLIVTALSIVLQSPANLVLAFRNG